MCVVSREAEAQWGNREKGQTRELTCRVSTMRRARHTVMLLLVIPELATVPHHQKRRLSQPFSAWVLKRVKPCPKPSTVCNNLPSFLCENSPGDVPSSGKMEKTVVPVSFCVL